MRDFLYTSLFAHLCPDSVTFLRNYLLDYYLTTADIP